MYMHAFQVSLSACIFSHVLSQTCEQHVSFWKNFYEMNVSQLDASVKFILSYIVYILMVEYLLMCAVTDAGCCGKAVWSKLSLQHT